MANETMTANRLPSLTWNWLKMNAARLEANAPAVGAAPSFVQTAQLASSSAAQDWAEEGGRGTEEDGYQADDRRWGGSSDTAYHHYCNCY